MAISNATQRSLRSAILLSFIPGLALIVPAGMKMTEVFLGFIGFGLTIITSSTYLVRERRRARSPFTFATAQQEENSIWSGFDILIWIMDFFIFGAYLGVLVPIWVRLPDHYGGYWGMGSEDVMLVTYSTVPMMLNMVIHFLLFLSNFPRGCSGIVAWIHSPEEPWFTGKAECPHCHHKIVGGVKGKENETVQKGEGYSLLRGEEYDEDVVGRASEEAAAPNVLEV